MTTERIDTVQPDSRLIDRLRAAAPPLRRERLAGVLREQLAYAIGAETDDIASDDRLMDLGIDSLRAVEVKLYLEDELGIDLGSSLLFDYPTLDALTGHLLEETGFVERQPIAAPPASEPVTELLDNLPEKELAALLDAELTADDWSRIEG
jgi:myxalamid-type polyketide synthase MxaB